MKKRLRVLGNELHVHDVLIGEWFDHDKVGIKIKSIKPYRGAYQRLPDWQGVTTVEFYNKKSGLTVFPDQTFLIDREDAS